MTGMKIVFQLFVFISLILIIQVCQNLPREPGARLVFEEEKYDFGKVEQGVVLTHIFDFENIGEDTLKISRVRSSWGCTASLLSSEVIAPGETGEAVLTGLCSDAQPFIRYRTGDIVKLSDKQSADGKGLHVIDEVSGRSTDFVVKSDGTIMHALAIIYILRAIDGLAEFKFIQHSLDSVEVVYVANSKWDNMASIQIEKELKKRLGDAIQVQMSPVEKIPAEASGKYRYVVSHVPLPNDIEALGNNCS